MVLWGDGSNADSRFFDSAIKGPTHLSALGPEYEVANVVYFVCSLIAIRVKKE
jgi:hypothetical protein